MSDNTLKSAWRRQKQWSKTAGNFKDSIGLWRKVVLGLAVLAAVAGTASTLCEPGSICDKVIEFFAAAAAALSPILAQIQLTTKQTEDWIRARAASEAYKAEIFRYRTRTGDYRGTDRAAVLNRAIAGISASVGDLARGPRVDYKPAPEQLSDLSIEDYLATRVTGQIDSYYRRYGDKNTGIARCFRIANFAAMITGALLGAASASFGLGLGPWIAVVTTIASSIIAHGAAGRHEYLALSYYATADELERIRNRWLDRVASGAPSEADEDKLVADCEDVISNENQSWRAKLIGAANQETPPEEDPDADLDDEIPEDAPDPGADLGEPAPEAPVDPTASGEETERE